MTCAGVIHGSFVACGEGGNYCSDACEAKARARLWKRAAKRFWQSAVYASRLAKDHHRMSLTFKRAMHAERAECDAAYEALGRVQDRCNGLLEEARTARAEARTLLAMMGVIADGAIRGELSEHGALCRIAEIAKEASGGV